MENLRCEKAVEKKHNGYNCAQAESPLPASKIWIFSTS